MQGTIKLYLEAIGLEEYQYIFQENEIGPQEFLSLTKDDLKELFPDKLGPRIRIFNLIQTLQSPDSNLNNTSAHMDKTDMDEWLVNPDPITTTIVNDFASEPKEKHVLPDSSKKEKNVQDETKTNDEKWKKIAMGVTIAGIGVTAAAGAVLAAPVIFGGFVLGSTAAAVGTLGVHSVAAAGLTAGSTIAIGSAAVAGTTAAAAGGMYLKTRPNEKSSQTETIQQTSSSSCANIGLTDSDDFYDDEDLLGIGLSEKDIPHSGVALKNNSKATQTRLSDLK